MRTQVSSEQDPYATGRRSDPSAADVSTASPPSPRGAVLPRLDARKLRRHLPETRRIRIEINGVLAGAPIVIPDAVTEFAIGWAFINRFYMSADQVTRVTSTASYVSLMIDSGVDLDQARYEAIGWIPGRNLEGGSDDTGSVRRPRAVPVMSELDAIATCCRSFDRFADDGARAGYRHVALATSDEVLCIARDVTSGAAAAKVLGWALPNSVDLSASILVASGIVDDLLVTASARAGIPIVATDAVPTVAAIAAAESGCVSLLGLVCSHRRGLFADGGHLDDAGVFAGIDDPDRVEPEA
jgi:formate dehydrogenase accessory protein FdhD